MMRIDNAPTALAAALVVFSGLSCDNSPSALLVEPTGYGRSYDVWRPVLPTECAPDVHNAYSVVGLDGKLYPTWHPPTDPATGCSFGHEHGRDPRGSALYRDLDPIAFGYANEQQDIADPHTMRHEDHVGHKIEWENDMRMTFEGGAGQILDVTCDVFTKLHQGSHSKDAFTNNLHELIYAIRCSDRTELRITLLTAIGRAGEMVASCDRDRVIQAGIATPPTSPNGNGRRAIPDRQCIEQHMLVPVGERSNYDAALRESWEVHASIRGVDGRTIASADPYFQILFPSRFFDSTQPDNVGRPITVCYETTPDGRAAREGLCSTSTANGTETGVTYADPRSRFNGVRRFVDINGNRIANTDGPEVWYTDPFGRNARTEPFPGSIRQYIARIDNTARVSHGPVIGRDRDYGAPGVRAPN
jgi:hypothetical protein